jgi:Zeta toxin
MSKAVDRLAVKLAQTVQGGASGSLVKVKAYVRKEGGRFEAVSAYKRKYEGLIGKTGAPMPTVTPAPRPLKGSPGRALRPQSFTPEQRKRAEMIETKVEQAKKDGLETDKQFAVQVGSDAKGNPVFTWDPKRAKQHDEILAHFWSKEFEKVPSEGKAVISGGIGGAGKSTILKNHADIERDAYGTVNPDDIKEYMAEKGMVPKIEGLDPMEASALIHEESSYLSKKLADKAYGEKKNMIWDITMNRPNSVQDRLDDFTKYGYGEVKAVFVDIPVELSVQRAVGRWWQGHEDPDVKIGGRYVSPTLIRSQAAEQGGTLNRRVFDKFAPKFDSWELWSTEGPTPKQISSSKGGVPKA